MNHSFMDVNVEPLITSSETYPRLEQMVAEAEKRVLLSFRIFDTRTRLRTESARDFSGGLDWAALLTALSSKGVEIRLQVSDFDPIAGADLHRDAWASLKHLDHVVGQNPDAIGRIEAMTARHPAAVGAFWRRAFRARALREVDRITRGFDGNIIEHFPGLVDILNGAMPHLYPATHHQKIALVDDRFALVGGLDVNERRWDTPDHDRPAAETWRDVSLAVYGAHSQQVAQAAEKIWNRCADDFGCNWSAKPPFNNLKLPEPRPLTATSPSDDFSICMTSSADARGLFSFGPKNTDDGTLRTVLAMIRVAKRFIYIETQFFRSARVAAALAEAARMKPELELIMVLPFAPERFAFTGKRDTAMRHAEALQSRAIGKIQKAFGHRLALLSPAKPTRRDDDDKFVAYGAGIVYVHSKVLIVDGTEALVGSANLNDRSLSWDTEVSARWHDPTKVAEFYKKIGDSWLGEVGASLQLAKTWLRAAERNAAVQPDLRKGFLLPYRTKRARKFSRRAFWLPDALF